MPTRQRQTISALVHHRKSLDKNLLICSIMIFALAAACGMPDTGGGLDADSATVGPESPSDAAGALDDGGQTADMRLPPSSDTDTARNDSDRAASDGTSTSTGTSNTETGVSRFEGLEYGDGTGSDDADSGSAVTESPSDGDGISGSGSYENSNIPSFRYADPDDQANEAASDPEAGDVGSDDTESSNDSARAMPVEVTDGSDGDKWPIQSGPRPPEGRRLMLAYVADVQLRILESQPMQVIVEASGALPTPCHELWWQADVNGTAYQIEVWSVDFQSGFACATVEEPFTLDIPLGGGFVSGDYTVTVNGRTWPVEFMGSGINAEFNHNA